MIDDNGPYSVNKPATRSNVSCPYTLNSRQSGPSLQKKTSFLPPPVSDLFLAN